MVRRRGAVYGDSESDQAIEVGLDELFGTDDDGMEDDPVLETDEAVRANDADSDEWRETEPDRPGASIGAAFFGWLVASGTAVLLLAWVGAVCTVIGWDKLWSGSDAGARWQLVGAWIVLVLSMGIGAFSGGYAGGRMVPAHGWQQGLGVWLFGWCAAGLIAGLGYLANRRYDLVARIDWPSLPVAEGNRTAAVLVALVAILLVTLLGAVLGGAAGNSCYGRLSHIDQRDE